MKVVLKQDVAHVGQKGSVVTVANGYGINCLIPRGMAFKADSPQGKSYVAKFAVAADLKQKAQDETRSNVESLVDKKLEVALEANESGTLFAAVTADKLAGLVMEQSGIKVMPSNLSISKDGIKLVGDYTINVVHAGADLGDFSLHISALK